MKTFEAFFTYRIKDAHGSRTADACVLVQAENVDTAQQKITAAFQRAVDGSSVVEDWPDPWTPIVTKLVRGLDHVLLGDVIGAVVGEYNVSPNDEKRTIAILRGLGYVQESPGSRRYKRPTPPDEVRKASGKPGAFENALNFVRTTPPAISGKGGHAHTFSVARMLVESPSLSDSDIWTLLLEFNQRCQPPWSETELRRKLDEAKAASGRVVAPVEPSTDFYCAHPACLLERNNNRNEPCPHCGRNNAGIGEGPPQETSVPLTVEEVAVVRRWLLSPRSGSYKRPYPKNPKLAPKTEPLTESELEALRVDATSLGSDGVLHFTKRDPLVLRLLDEHANMKTTLADAYETQKRDQASSAEEPGGSTETLAVYKLRTECWADTIRLLREVHADRVTIDGAEVTLENPRGFGGDVLSIEKLRELIRNFPDSHVMTETLSVADTYTGERTRTQEQT